LSVDSDRAAIVSVDGADGIAMRPGDIVRVRRSDHVTRFVRVGPRQYFYSAVSARLR
jgi:NAD kinase